MTARVSRLEEPVGCLYTPDINRAYRDRTHVESGRGRPVSAGNGGRPKRSKLHIIKKCYIFTAQSQGYSYI